MGVSVGGWLLAALKENLFAFSASTGVCFIATTGITGAPRGHGLHSDSNSVCEHASPMQLWVKQVDHRKRRRRALDGAFWIIKELCHYATSVAVPTEDKDRRENRRLSG